MILIIILIIIMIIIVIIIVFYHNHQQRLVMILIGFGFIDGSCWPILLSVVGQKQHINCHRKIQIYINHKVLATKLCEFCLICLSEDNLKFNTLFKDVVRKHFLLWKIVEFPSPHRHQSHPRIPINKDSFSGPQLLKKNDH